MRRGLASGAMALRRLDAAGDRFGRRRLKGHGLLVALAFGGSVTAAAIADTAPTGGAGDIQRRLDTTIDRAIAEQRIVGTVVVLLCDGQVIYQRAAGYLDREARTPMPENAIFRLASSSKAITSATAMALIDRGQLTLDDTVTKWLPEFSPKSPDGSTPTITVRELLTHTAGLDYPFWEPRDGPYRLARVSSGLDQPGLSMDEELSRITAAGLVSIPGTEWRYSLSVDVLGAVIAKAAGKPLPEVVRELITLPLGMADTGFRVTDPNRLAVPYFSSVQHPGRMAAEQAVDFGDSISLVFAPARAFDSASFPSGGAGMLGTARDFTRFLEMIRLGGGTVLKPETVRSMMANQIGNRPILLGPGWGFGFGAAVVTDAAAAGTPLPNGSWSWSGAYGTSWFTDPKNGYTVVAFTDTAPEGDSGAFAMEIRGAVYGVAPR